MGNRRRDCQGNLRPWRVDALSTAMGKVDEEREKRLAEALRDNLRRRKARGREAETPEGKDLPAKHEDD
ncbi:MAG: hypothetical protein JWN69_2567 [Alphaproteobacteria bacterium]|nr:hypothetical protein [Alphaproteobacteria bacterium]